MATTLSCTLPLIFTRSSNTKPTNKLTQTHHNLDSQFKGVRKGLGFCKPTSRIGPCSNGSRTTCWFKFGKNGVDAEGAGIYGSQSRDDFDRDDVEQYFNYMGMLAVEGTYDKMEALLRQNIHPVDILLMMAASEGDKPKIEELLKAGAKYDVKDSDGKTALDRASDDEIKNLILSYSAQKA
ncbi:putative ankyrin repeat-containing domain, protein LHCP TRANSLOCATION DEFECT [Helianthus annuus]|nr:putative ankyrin repeat-containing domain, protein LHCP TRANSLOCATION DEFECT [Helianthus annuus]